MHEWSLLIYTLLMQLCVGVYLVQEILRYTVSKGKYITEINMIGNRLLVFICMLAVFATFVSFFHLGNPFKAYNALNNLSSSWLSREILFQLAFLLGVAAVIAIRLTKIFPDWLKKGVSILTGLLGIVLIFTMAKLYMLTTIPVWNNLTTPVSFFITTFLLGGFTFLSGMILLKKSILKNSPNLLERFNLFFQKSSKMISLFSIMFLGLEILMFPVLILLLRTNLSVEGNSIGEMSMNQLFLMILRFILILSAVVSIGIVYHKPKQSRVTSINSRLIVMIFLIILFSEILGRFVFYASYSQIGI